MDPDTDTGPEIAAVRPLPTALAIPLEIALNRLLAAAPDSAVARLSGRSIAVAVQPPGLGLVLLGAADRLQVLGSLDDEDPDVTISGSPVGLAAAIAREDRSGITLQGDAVVLADLQRAFSGVSFDWAGWLESIAGAGAAGPVLRAGESLRDQLRRFMDRSLEDSSEYLQEEARWLPASGEFEALAADLADLRDDVARLEARIARLGDGNDAAVPVGPGLPRPG
ncbi:MAG: SCP2 sterol-binding domain-containing protein [Thioalkalivibrio sp.]|nr:SCP2 sterol-binding domain-containing protein [Thioalkalivibrio sp.]